MQSNKYITDKLVNGVWYERAPKTPHMSHCHGCVGVQENLGICTELSEKDCSYQFIYKAKEGAKVQQVGVKYDDNKLKYSLIPSYALEAVAKNLTAGLKKYPHRDNWQLVDNAEERYLDALMRHLEQHRRGEIYDTDNIDPTTTHLSAVSVNCMFLLEFLLNPNINTNGLNVKSK